MIVKFSTAFVLIALAICPVHAETGRAAFYSGGHLDGQISDLALDERGLRPGTLDGKSRRPNFRKNYGTIVGGYLYLRSISAAGARSVFWRGLFFTAVTAGFGWLQRLG
jgi:hypothetical protein